MKAMMAEVAQEHFSMQAKGKKCSVRIDLLTETMAALENASLDDSQKIKSSFPSTSIKCSSSKESFCTTASGNYESSLSSDSS